MGDQCEEWCNGRQMLLDRSKLRALTCLNEHEYSRAFAHFIVVLTVEPSVKGEILNAFLFTLDKLVGDLENEGKLDDVLMCYQQALEVLPTDSHILHGLGATLFRLGWVESAAGYFLKAYKENPFFTPSLYCMENLKNALFERWHYVMLNDGQRNLAYKKAIEKAVDDGYNRVLDIGAGTGILSMIAMDAKASKVYACESSEIMFAVLQNVLNANDKFVESFSKFSSDLTVPDDLSEKVTLIVTEIFDAGLFGENSLMVFNHAWKHLLRNPIAGCSVPNSDSDVSEQSCSSETTSPQSELILMGKIIPYSATVFAVPVECEHLRKYIRLDDRVTECLGLKELQVLPQVLDEEPYSSEKINSIPGQYKMLSNPTVLLEANFNSPDNVESLLQGEIFTSKFSCLSNGQLDAIVVWFELHLDEKTSISTAPKDISDSGCWEQAIFYVFPQHLEGSPLLQTGESIEVKFLCKGHLTLQAIKTSIPEAHIEPVHTLHLEPSLIYLLNSYATSDVIGFDLKDLLLVDNSLILDVSTFPVLSLNALRNGSSRAIVLRTQYQSEIEKLQEFYGIPKASVIFKSYEDLYEEKMECDLLVVDPVEMCGLLKKNIFEDILLLKKQWLKETGTVVPSEVEIHAILVDSDVLIEQSKVISDERTLGYKISQIMNAYQCKIHQDIQFSTLAHQKMSKAVELCCINFNSNPHKTSASINLHGKQEVSAITDGKISAVVYWFTLRYAHKRAATTSDWGSPWKQAAYILEDEIRIASGEKLSLQWKCKNGFLQFAVQSSESATV